MDRKPGLALVVVLLGAATANLATQWAGRGSWGESVMGSLGFLDANHLAEQAYRDLWAGNLKGQGGAVREAERALVSDMASAYRWCDLGEVFLDAGIEDKAKDCLRRAVELGPRAPQILMRAANGFFRVADVQPALACTRQILAIVSVYDLIIFSAYTRMGVTVEQALAQGLPAGDPRPVRAFMGYLLARHSLDDAREVWAWAGPRHALTDELADRYVAALIQARQYDAAVDQWVSYLGSRGGRGSNDCLFNGSFEHDPFGETFDWRIQPLPGARVERDTKVAYTGHAALRIHFDGTKNVSFNHVRQTAVVRPGIYRFEGRLRTENITTDQGIALRVHDADYADRLNATTAGVAGTTGWVTVAQDVKITAPTRLVTIEIVRDPSEKFDSAISGTAWVDDIKMVRRQP
jgi:hypothetical protein